MADLILLILTFTQIPVFFILAARVTIKMNSYLALKKNTNWISENPSFTKYKRFEKAALILSYAMGFVTMALFVLWVFITPQPTMHMALFIGPVFAMSIGFVLYSILFHQFVTRKIPDPEKRVASTQDRRLSAYVPMWIVNIGYAAFIAVIVPYGFALFSGEIASELAVARFLGLFGILIIVTGILTFMLRRKYSELETILGSKGRKVEVLACVSVLYLGVFTGVYRILGDFYGVSLFTDASFFIVISIVIQGWFIGASLSSKLKTLLNNHVGATAPQK